MCLFPVTFQKWSQVKKFYSTPYYVVKVGQRHLRLTLTPSVPDKALGKNYSGPVKGPMNQSLICLKSTLLDLTYKTIHMPQEGTKSLISIFTLLILNLELTWTLDCKPCRFTPCCLKGDRSHRLKLLFLNKIIKNFDERNTSKSILDFRIAISLLK